MPIAPPTACSAGIVCVANVAATAIATDSPMTIVEWPSEKKKPTATGRFPSCISLRVTLSIAEMWSASTAWRRPNVYASSAVPSSSGRVANAISASPHTATVAATSST